MRSNFILSIVLLSIFLLSCSTSPVDPNYDSVLISKDLLADWFGDKNGTTSQAEMDLLDSFFCSNLEAWAMGSFPGGWRTDKIRFSNVFYHLKTFWLFGPYESEKELRAQGFTGLPSPVGIFVFVLDFGKTDMVRIKHLYKSPGSRIGEQEWVEATIIPDHEWPKPGINPPVADAGTDQTINAGGYAVMDANGSTPGNGFGLYYYKWTQDENNPAEVRGLYSGLTVKQNIGFIKEGTYRFTLVVNNAVEDSEPDELVITVNPRVNTVFEDINLEIKVRFVMKKPAGELTEEDFLRVTEIGRNNISVKSITSLKGLEYCSNLVKLNIRLKDIADLSPLTNLENLVYLDLHQIRLIKDISPLSGLTNLQYLNLENNKIEDVTPLANLTQLTYLNIDGNPVRSISALSGLKNLKEFRMGHAPVYDISSLAEMTELVSLRINGSQIMDVTPLENLINLHTVDLRYNKISIIPPLKKLSQLQYLSLDKNEISDISALEGLIRLKHLKLDNNKISDISVLKGLVGLERLELRDNEITDISSLKGLKKLSHLDLEDNLISDISPLKNLVNLNIIHLENNRISNILPLANNIGLGSGNSVILEGNPLSEKSVNVYIPALESRGVRVRW